MTPPPPGDMDPNSMDKRAAMSRRSPHHMEPGLHSPARPPHLAQMPMVTVAAGMQSPPGLLQYSSVKVGTFYFDLIVWIFI